MTYWPTRRMPQPVPEKTWSKKQEQKAEINRLLNEAMGDAHKWRHMNGSTSCKADHRTGAKA